MPMVSMSARPQRDWDRNAYHLGNGVVLIFRIHLERRLYLTPGSVSLVPFVQGSEACRNSLQGHDLLAGV
jgi:hypothetical protein